MAKGAESKAKIVDKILEVFPGAFVVDAKEIRIPMIEDSAEVQIKVALTCAKENIGHGTDGGEGSSEAPNTSVSAVTPPTDEEISNVRKIMAELNL